MTNASNKKNQKVCHIFSYDSIYTNTYLRENIYIFNNVKRIFPDSEWKFLWETKNIYQAVNYFSEHNISFNLAIGFQWLGNYWHEQLKETYLRKKETYSKGGSVTNHLV